MATFVIGDIHGNLPALTDLLGQVEPLLTRDDTLVFLGDYIDRGPDSRGCGVLTAIRLPDMQVIQSARYRPGKAHRQVVHQ
jgi:hypothetical protein